MSREREAVRPTEVRPELGGWTETIERTTDVSSELKAAYLSLPYGDRSFRFQEAGYFANVARFAPEFDFVLRHLPTTGQLLDLGADSTWSTARLARRGFRCIALDITEHLVLGDLYQANGPSYGRVLVDMHEPVFRDGALDIITAFNAMHHSGRLPVLAGRIASMLKPGGVLGFVEPYVQSEAQRQQFATPQLEADINENIHTLSDWHRTFSDVGMGLRTFAISDSFNAIYQKLDGAADGRSLEIESDGTANDYYASVLIASPARQRVRVNEAAEFRVSVVNRGVAGWSSRGPHPVRLSYHIAQVAPGGAPTSVAFDNERTVLSAFIGPGERSEHVVRVRFESPGAYQVEFDLVHEARCWFRERGGQTSVVECEVE